MVGCVSASRFQNALPLLDNGRKEKRLTIHGRLDTVHACAGEAHILGAIRETI